ILPLAAALVAGCASAPDAKGRSALTADQTPADFALSVTVSGPPPVAATPRSARPARYIVQPDGVLRAVVGPVTDMTFPPLTRLLTHDQTQRLWWDLRDSGLPGRAPAPEDSDGAATRRPLPPGAPPPLVYVVSWSIAGHRRTVWIDAARAAPEDA